MPDTTPFCSHCGYDFVTKNVNLDHFCDSCGADLFFSVPAGDGPSNAPSVPAVSDAGGQVASATWTPAPNFDVYALRWTVDGVVKEIVNPATTPETYSGATAGQEVCAALKGQTDGIWSPWSADDCVTLA